MLKNNTHNIFFIYIICRKEKALITAHSAIKKTNNLIIIFKKGQLKQC